MIQSKEQWRLFCTGNRPVMVAIFCFNCMREEERVLQFNSFANLAKPGMIKTEL